MIKCQKEVPFLVENFMGIWMNYLHGITNVYESFEAAAFKDVDNYPIAWEVIALHNTTGKSFIQNISAAFKRLNRSSGYVFNLDAREEEGVFCLGCVFKDKAAFAKILNECMSNVVIYDEHIKSPVLKPMLLEAAEKLAVKPMPEVT
ncbi:MAG: hypothetical protein GC192_21315 [Bacteroidetes bacterium]|nr:hypothetical protein [Bacteroidota bacterium]